jgi:hypothetical protein
MDMKEEVYVLQYVRRFCAHAIQKLSPSTNARDDNPNWMMKHNNFKARASILRCTHSGLDRDISKNEAQSGLKTRSA